jgi:hypothetical protein
MTLRVGQHLIHPKYHAVSAVEFDQHANAIIRRRSVQKRPGLRIGQRSWHESVAKFQLRVLDQFALQEAHDCTWR